MRQRKITRISNCCITWFQLTKNRKRKTFLIFHTQPTMDFLTKEIKINLIFFKGSFFLSFKFIYGLTWRKIETLFLCNFFYVCHVFIFISFFEQRLDDKEKRQENVNNFWCFFAVFSWSFCRIVWNYLFRIFSLSKYNCFPPLLLLVF